LHPLNTPDVPHPADYTLVQGMQGDYWWCPPGGTAGARGAGRPVTTEVSLFPPGRPSPPRPLLTANRVPSGVPPGGALPAAQDACTRPDNTTAQAVYVVPWLGERARAASAFSECGRKLIAEAQYPIVDAARIAAALSRPYGYVDVVTDLEQPTDPLDGGASIGLLG
jgi:hypothetical protein